MMKKLTLNASTCALLRTPCSLFIKACLLLIFCASAPAFAQNYDYEQAEDNRFYLTAMGISESNIDYAGNKDGTTNETASGFYLSIGYEIYPFLDAELGYSVLDDYKNEVAGKENSTDADMLEIATLWHFPGDKAEPYLRIAYAQSEVSVTQQGKDLGGSSRDGFTWGLGADWNLTNNSALRVDYTVGEIEGGDEDLERLMFGLVLKFK